MKRLAEKKMELKRNGIQYAQDNRSGRRKTEHNDKKKSNLFFRCSVRGGEVGIIDVICDCNWVRSGHQNIGETDNFIWYKIDK